MPEPTRAAMLRKVAERLRTIYGQLEVTEVPEHIKERLRRLDEAELAWAAQTEPRTVDALDG